jgi:uncharacterized YigZ family protein
MNDVYRTIAGTSEGYHTEQRSRFISFAVPVRTPEEAKEKVDALRKQYYDARHVCWAFMTGAERTQFRVNDDGEPSSTAGKPILGVINSNRLTDILIAVVRYFGGVKLGTGGLIAAYRAAAQDAVDNAQIIDRTVDEEFTVTCEYNFLNSVMKIIREENPQVLDRQFGSECIFRLRIRQSRVQELKGKLSKAETVRILHEPQAGD